jgi:tight adherence protein B
MGTPELIAGATFVVVVAMVVVPYLVFVLRPEAASQEILRQRIKTGGAAVRAKAAGASLLKDVERFSVIGPLNRMLAGSNAVAANLRDLVHMSGVKMTPGQIVLGSACLALFGYVLTITWVPSIWLGVIVGLATGAAPYTVLRIIRARRLNKFEEQFPEAVDLIARTLRAGHALTTGLKMAADELPQPVAAEFKLLYDQQNYGLPLTDGLHALAQRVPLRVVSAHGRLTGAVLAALPPVLALFLMIRMPEHFKILVEEPAGIRMIVVAVMLQLFGAFLIYRITKVEY